MLVTCMRCSMLGTCAPPKVSTLHSPLKIESVGLAMIYKHFLQMGYGNCQRALCDKQSLLPFGMYDKLRAGRVKVYCPKCEEIYIPTKKFNLDGAFFGPSLVHIFLAEYKKVVVLPPARFYYEPKMHGFSIAGKRGSKYFNPCRGTCLARPSGNLFLRPS